MSVDKTVAGTLQAWAIKYTDGLDFRTINNVSEETAWLLFFDCEDEDPTEDEEDLLIRKYQEQGYSAVRVRIEEVKEGE